LKTFPTATFPSQIEFWNSWHRHRGATGDDEPHCALRQLFLSLMVDYPGGRVADLGCGQGHDALAFVGAGLGVTALDFSPVSIGQVRRAGRGNPCLDSRLHDLARPLPFDDGSLHGVYSHLSLHYFDDITTRSIFEEISRVLVPGGVLVFSVKSTDDPYYGTGEQVGPQMFCRNGHVRHFFSQDYLDDLLTDWKRKEIRPYQGHYASHEPSSFLHAAALKPQ
jgi:SAM-dependent methyltransferase